MRLISFGIIIALLASFSVDRTNAQIPERVLFQPGSYAGGAYQGAGVSAMPTMQTVMVPVSSSEMDDNAADDSNKTEWEKSFGTKQQGIQMKEVQVPMPGATGADCANSSASSTQTPYLAYHRCPITGRTHIIPYQKGYPDPETFPKTQCTWKLWMSSHPSQKQNQPQIEYLDYYAPMPEIIVDKPSRMQLLLGYPDPAWTSSCDNKWGHRLAQCKGIEMYACGPPAEWCIKDQCNDTASARSHLGSLQGNPGAYRGNMIFGRRLGALRAAAPAPYANGWCSSCQKAPCQTCKSCNSCLGKGCKTGCKVAKVGCQSGACGEGCGSGCGCAPPSNKFPKEISSEE